MKKRYGKEEIDEIVLRKETEKAVDSKIKKDIEDFIEWNKRADKILVWAHKVESGEIKATKWV